MMAASPVCPVFAVGRDALLRGCSCFRLEGKTAPRERRRPGHWHSAGLAAAASFVGTLLPPSIIVLALTTLNLADVAFSLLGGIRADDCCIHDTSHGVIVILTARSMIASPLLLPG